MEIAVQRPEWGKNYDVGYSGFVVYRHSFIAAGIQWFEKWDSLGLNAPPPTHALIITGEDETVEAMTSGVQVGTISAYLNDPDAALLVRRPWMWTAEIGQAIAREGLEYVGQKYGFRLIAALAAANTLTGRLLDLISRRGFTRLLSRMADSKREQICSELVARAMAAQWHLTGFSILRQPPASIKPVDLFKDRFIYEPGDYAVELDTGA